MKRFIIISLLAAMVLPSFACAGGGTDNYYLFCVCDKQEFRTRVYDICNKNWQAYPRTGKRIWAIPRTTSGLMPTKPSK